MKIRAIIKGIDVFMAACALALVYILLLPNPVFADDWSTEDKQREAIFIATGAMDWLQTRNVARNPDGWHETNPILGRHPSIGRVNNYFLGAMLVHVGIVHLLPAEYRPVFQTITIFIEAGYVANNYQLGASTKF